MQINKVDVYGAGKNEEFSYERPVLQIRRWNRCLWILIVTAAWTVLMLGFTIPGIIGLANGDYWDDILLYVGLISLIFAGLFFTFWYICQYETSDITQFERHVTRRRTKRLDDGSRHSRPKSIRSTLTKGDPNTGGQDTSKTPLAKKTISYSGTHIG